MPLSLNDQIYFDFLAQIETTLSSKNDLDVAIYHSGIALVASKRLGLSTLDEYGVFDDDGKEVVQQSREAKITINLEKMAAQQIDPNHFKQFSLRDQLILESARNFALQKVLAKYRGTQQPPMTQQALDELIQRQQARVIMDLTLKLRSKRVMTTSKSYELHLEAKDGLNMGHHLFTGTNISISPGPQIKAPPHDLYDAETRLEAFFYQLEKNKIHHIFAIGHVFPYFPQDGEDLARLLLKTHVSLEDFCNYFIPGPDGFVKLPAPRFANFKIESKIISKVDRITVYEIRVNDGPAIQVHHYPLRDKQPLDLTDAELTHVKSTQNPAQKILTHCRAGRGRSAQLAYVLAALTDKFNANRGTPERGTTQLADMRTDITGGPKTHQFVETEMQEKYLMGLEGKLYGDLPARPHANGSEFIKLLMCIFKEEIEAFVEADGPFVTERGLLSVDSLSGKRMQQIEFIELYHKLSEAQNETEAKAIAEEAKQLACVSETFEGLFTFNEQYLYWDRLIARAKACGKSDHPLGNHKLLFGNCCKKI